MAVADTYDGFVTIQRSMKRWEWFRDPYTAHLFLFLILSANHEDHNFRGVTVHRGELITSYPHMARETGLTVRQARTAIEHLKLTGEVTCKSTNRYTLIHIANYDMYQNTKRRPDGRQKADKRQADGRQTTTNNNYNNENHEEPQKNIYSRPPSVVEVESFARNEGLSVNAQDFVDYNNARGWAGIKDWRPLVRIRARQVSGYQINDDELDEFGKPVRKEFK